MEMVKKQIAEVNSYVNDASAEAVREAVYQCRLSQCSKPWWSFSKQFLNIIESRVQDTYLGSHTLQRKLTSYEISTIHFQLKNLPKLLKLFKYAPLSTYILENYFSLTEICMQDIAKQLLNLCDFVTKNNLSTQNKIDIVHEHNRLLVLLYNCQLYQILSNRSIIESELSDLIIQLANAGYYSKHKVSTEHASTICSKLNEIAKKHGIDIIFKQERMEVTNDVGLINGAWYKCNKGRFVLRNVPLLLNH